MISSPVVLSQVACSNLWAALQIPGAQAPPGAKGGTVCPGVAQHWSSKLPRGLECAALAESHRLARRLSSGISWDVGETPQVPLQTHQSRPRGRGSLRVYEPAEGSDTYSGFRSSDSDHSSPLTVPSVTRSLSPLETGTWLRVPERLPLGVLGESADLSLWHPAHVLQETLFSARLAAALRSGHWGSVRTPSPRSSPHSSWTAVTTRALLPPGPHSSIRPGLSPCPSPVEAEPPISDCQPLGIWSLLLGSPGPML